MYATYNAFFFVTFEEWGERTAPEEQYAAIKAHLNRELAKLPEAIAFAFPPPAIPGVGTSGGVTFMLQDRSGGERRVPRREHAALPGGGAQAARDRLGHHDASWPTCRSSSRRWTATRCSSRASRIEDVYQTLQAFMGGYFVNYFNRFGRTWQVYVQAEGEFRTRAGHVGQFRVLNDERRHGAALGARLDGADLAAPSSRCASTSTARRRST